MTVQDLLDRAEADMAKNPAFPWHAVLLNALYHLEPKICAKIVGTEYDPFFKPERIESFLKRVEELLKE